MPYASLCLAVLLVVLTNTPSSHARAVADPIERPAVGAVNGDTIWLDDFAREVGRRSELRSLAVRFEQADVVQSTWDDMVLDRLLLQEAVRRGIDVTTAMVDSILLNDPPDYIRRGIVDEKGRFDKGLLHGMLLRPDSTAWARSPKDTPDEHRRHVQDIRDVMDDLRSRLRLVMIRSLVRTRIEAEAVIDTAALKEHFLTAASTCTADLLAIPCGDAAQDVPSDGACQVWLAKNAQRYQAKEEIRRCAYMAFPMTPTPADSADVLQRIRRFVADCRAMPTQRGRDSLFLLVAANTLAAPVVLHPDSAATRAVYDACRGKAVGSVVGPVVLAGGIAVAHVDSVHPTSIDATMILTSIDPGPATIDSILQRVQAVIDDYESGMDLGTVADRAGRDIKVTPWFMRREKVFGSWRLADVAFGTPRGLICDPVDTPEMGVVLAVVIDSVAPGPLPLDACRDQVRADLAMENACMAQNAAIQALYARCTVKGGALTVNGTLPAGATIERAVTVDRIGSVGETRFDADLVRQVYAKPGTGLRGPYRGSTGWYILNVRAIDIPSMDEFPLYLSLRGDDLVAMQRQEHYNTVEQRLRSTANIVDQRWITFRY